MHPPETAAGPETVASLAARLAAAEQALTAREKTVQALVTRERERTAKRSSTFAVMEENAGLQQVVARKTLELEAQNHQLEQTVVQLKRTEETLRESEERFAGAFEHAPIGVALVLPGGQWLKVNRALCELVGYSEAKLLTRTFQDITHPEDLGADLENVRRLIAGEIRSYQMEKRYVHGRGHLVTVLLDVSLVRDGQGQPLYFIAQIQDITARKRAETELENVNKQLAAASRQAGMAEVATSVLHNVGNVLNSVSVSAEVVAGKVRQSRAGGLKTVAVLLREHAHDLPAFLTHDPRGKELPDYLLKLIEHLAEPQPGILQELETQRKNIEHIKEIVATQQRHARGSGVMETLAVAELVEEALSINAAGFGRHGVELIKEFSPVPPVVTDRHKVLQILVNLVNNAKHALAKVAGEKRLIVRVTLNETDGVRIAVIDNGVGIAPENLTQIFQHGFTTKKDGHGFGLHSGALAAKELGGRLSVHSDGLGRGAVFTLELPLQNKKELR